MEGNSLSQNFFEFLSGAAKVVGDVKIADAQAEANQQQVRYYPEYPQQPGAVPIYAQPPGLYQPDANVFGNVTQGQMLLFFGGMLGVALLLRAAD